MRNIYYIIVIITNLLVITACNFFAVGSYPYAEYYTFDVSCDSLINKIEQFKSENLEYNVIVDGNIKEDYIDENNFYEISFYLKKDNIIIYNVINMY